MSQALQFQKINAFKAVRIGLLKLSTTIKKLYGVALTGEIIFETRNLTVFE